MESFVPRIAVTDPKDAVVLIQALNTLHTEVSRKFVRALADRRQRDMDVLWEQSTRVMELADLIMLYARDAAQRATDET